MARVRRYQATAKGSAAKTRYRSSEKGQEAQRLLDRERILDGRLAQVTANWQQTMSEESREKRREYDREYRKRPDARLAESLGVGVETARDIRSARSG